MRPDEALWGLHEQLLAHVSDLLAIANWQRAGAGKRPEPLPRPGVEPTSKTHGKGAIPLDEMREWLGWD